jgi:hypothetical protein
VSLFFPLWRRATLILFPPLGGLGNSNLIALPLTELDRLRWFSPFRQNQIVLV